MRPGLVGLLFLVTAGPAVAADPPRVRVTVVAVLATTENNVIDPKLTALAREVQKREPALIGFRLVGSEARSLPVGTPESFVLVEKQDLRVTVDEPRTQDGRYGLTIRPPGAGEISYTCACSKFFPVLTPHQTAAGDRLLVAVMAKPCTPPAKK